jgi:response regulator NasT
MTERDRKQGRPHILVLDKDSPLAAELSDSLRAAGYRVTEVTSGDDALQVAAQDAPDLAVLDVRSSDMNGVRIGGELHERSGVPFLCLSDPVDQETAAEAAERGALGYLVKPLAVQQIMPSIEAALTRGSDIRKLRENESQLNNALASTRAVSMAVGLLMMRDHINRDQALDLLRTNARVLHRPVADMAVELLSAVENIYKINKISDKSESRRQAILET